MKKFNVKIFLVLFVICIQLSVINSQNLVPNPSFEDTTGVGCPNGITWSSLPTGWSSYWNTPDYFNTCSPATGFSSVPNNGWGYQFASSGNAYCGVWVMQTIQQNLREYIGIQLITPLIIGKKYFINLKVSLAEISNCGINNIGVLLSTVSYDYVNPVNIMNFSHVYSSAINTDTANWTNISGSFIADSAYKYIIIGNFFNDANTDTIITGYPEIFCYGAYYFIDDIYLGTDSLSNMTILSFENEINIYPNPANDYINFDIRPTLKKFPFYCNIYNSFGNKIWTLINPEIFQCAELSNGIYFFQLILENKIINKKIIINH